MKHLFTVALLTFVGQSYGQQEVKINLADNVTLTLLQEKFDQKGKDVEFTDDKYVISIDKKPVFGTDGEMPRTFLKKATLAIGTRVYDLQVDGMYNAWLDGYFTDKIFKLKKEGLKYKVTGGLSDGAGSYGVEWVAVGKGSIRTILTDDESIRFEYMER
ncbi:MAG: hypothetical protein WD824_18235 [Cyclobacteriaceae bacterium]